MGDGKWELRPDDGTTCDPSDPLARAPGTTRDNDVVGSFDDIVAALGVDMDFLDVGGIEDLANLNLNCPITLADMVRFTGFTLRTTVFPAEISAVPLPAGAPLLFAGLGAFAAFRRRRTAAAA